MSIEYLRVPRASSIRVRYIVVSSSITLFAHAIYACSSFLYTHSSVIQLNYLLSNYVCTNQRVWRDVNQKSTPIKAAVVHSHMVQVYPHCGIKCYRYRARMTLTPFYSRGSVNAAESSSCARTKGEKPEREVRKLTSNVVHVDEAPRKGLFRGLDGGKG